jgi:hypothetical protein
MEFGIGKSIAGTAGIRYFAAGCRLGRVKTKVLTNGFAIGYKILFP